MFNNLYQGLSFGILDVTTMYVLVNTGLKISFIFKRVQNSSIFKKGEIFWSTDFMS